MTSHRHIVLGIVESMDVCDATRSHELAPAARLYASARARRLARVLLTSTAAVLSIFAAAAAWQV